MHRFGDVATVAFTPHKGQGATAKTRILMQERSQEYNEKPTQIEWVEVWILIAWQWLEVMHQTDCFGLMKIAHDLRWRVWEVLLVCPSVCGDTILPWVMKRDKWALC